MPRGRPPLPAPAGAAVYFAVAEAPGDAARPGTGHAAVSVHDNGRPAVTLENNGGDASPMTTVADRAGPRGGRVPVTEAVCRVEILCA